eukprot:5634217-Amphidinium_carterae.1
MVYTNVPDTSEHRNNIQDLYVSSSCLVFAPVSFVCLSCVGDLFFDVTSTTNVPLLGVRTPVESVHFTIQGYNTIQQLPVGPRTQFSIEDSFAILITSCLRSSGRREGFGQAPRSEQAPQTVPRDNQFCSTVGGQHATLGSFPPQLIATSTWLNDRKSQRPTPTPPQTPEAIASHFLGTARRCYYNLLLVANSWRVGI